MNQRFIVHEINCIVKHKQPSVCSPEKLVLQIEVPVKIVSGDDQGFFLAPAGLTL